MSVKPGRFSTPSPDGIGDASLRPNPRKKEINVGGEEWIGQGS